MIPGKRGLRFKGVLLVMCLPLATAAEPLVAASLKPVHALVAGVMGKVSEPALLVKASASPHGYSLRPSQVRLIHDARVVFWIGASLERFLEKPLAGAPGRNVALLEAPGVDLLKRRKGGLWQDHDHDDHDHEHDIDPHIWLNPRNAMAMVRHIMAVLIEEDPAHRTDYEENGAVLLQRLQTLDQALAVRLEPLRDIPYLVFHDAYQYLQQRYGLNGVGAVLINPEHRPGAKRLQTIREHKAHCLFGEPQFKPALIATLIEGTEVEYGVLDPLGVTLPAGVEAYFQLMEALVTALEVCLGSAP